ncbi:fluoride efflux transporter CrcB [Sphingomonas prati]|uniref:Fluoride-specific ion channel FluC n=1 Tax=Sphingomonas prati TaxID=1843237 RepID=A0A7W9BQ70_9SPHN|nr:fluoride efflux transporter CrcB [Sphingomonas prati]MBB5728084.1 CrcB protein [Sphingomonas prati]GGE83117.1 putative fluoride ion transporter CrcB [Sphingomonas prati]
MPSLLLVMGGGAIGSGLRYLVGRLALAQFGPGFPFGTLAVNLIGGALMGLLAGLLARDVAGESVRLLLGVGVMGGFTTFSAFSLETVLMLQRGELATALGYVLVSVLGALAALFVGLQAARVLA